MMTREQRLDYIRESAARHGLYVPDFDNDDDLLPTMAEAQEAYIAAVEDALRDLDTYHTPGHVGYDYGNAFDPMEL